MNYLRKEPLKLFIIIQFNRLALPVSAIMLNLILVSLFIYSFFLWLAVKFNAVFPALLVSRCIVAVMGAFLLTLYLLDFFASLRNSSLNQIKNNMKILRRRQCNFGCYLKNMWKLQRPLSIHCGQRFALTKEAVMIYIRVLTDVVTDILIL